MNEKLGIGYIGFGKHCNLSHVPFLEESPLAQAVGVADVADVEVGHVNFADDPVVTKDYRELLEDDRIDAVVVTTGDSSHYSITEDALEAGKHVLVEKPAAATVEELAALPSLFDKADAKQRNLWVCHPREFGAGPWSAAARLIGNPQHISAAFDTGPMGKLQELRYDCLYTVPGKQGLHTSFADDKLNHTIVSAMRSLPETTGFRNAVLLDNGLTNYDARLVTVADNADQDGIVVRASGRRSANPDNHGGGVYRDWVEAVFDEGTLRVEPTLGRIVLTYGKEEKPPIVFDPAQLYDGMFSIFNDEFVRRALDSSRPEALSRQAKLLGTAGAILMQQPNFNGEISEAALQQLN